MIKYNNTNNASTTLTAGISASSTTLLVDNGDILPNAPFLLTLEHFDNEKVTVREIVKCIAKVGTILTIQRGAGTCVQDDTATPKAQNNTPHSFSVGDCASIYWTSEQVQDIQNEIEKKLNIDDFQAGTYVYGATSTGTDAYSITIPGTLTSYAVGQVFRFMADVDNEGNATLNINGLGAVEIRKNHDKILDNGDIEAGQIVEVAYDGTYFQMDSQVATVVDVASLGNTQYKTGVAGEDLEVGDVCCLVDFENDYFEMKLFGTTESSVEYEVIGNGGNDNSITLWLGRRGNSSGEDLVVELLDGETVIASSQIARSGLTEDTTVETVCSWGENIETEKGKLYTLRLRTYDNSVDADKGFYYNRTESDGCESWYKTSSFIPSYGLTLSGKNYFNAETDYYDLSFGMAFSCSKLSTRIDINRHIVIYGEQNTINLSVHSEGTTFNVNVNGTTNVGSVPLTFAFLGNKINNVDIPEDNYTRFKFTVDQHSSGTYDSTYGVNVGYSVLLIDNPTVLNFKSSFLNNKLFYKGNSRYDVFVNTTNINKSDDCVFEVGGISNIISGKRRTSKQVGATFLGNIDSNRKLEYKPKYYIIEKPTKDTDFYLGKDAIMVCSFGVASYTLKKDGTAYRNFSYNANGYGSTITENVEWRLEGGHTYQIDFDPSAIKDFYYVD